MKKLLTLLLAGSALWGAAQTSVYYSTDFKGASLQALGMSALDANADGNTWTPQTSTATFRNLDGQSITAVDRTPVTIGNFENDDWLFTPGILFEAGKTYELELELSKYNYAAVENSLEVKIGAAKTADAQTVTLLTQTDCIYPQLGGNSLWTKRATISVPATGDYYISFHATGKPGQKIGVARLSIAAGVGLSTPASPQNFTVTPDPSGLKKAEISLTAPSLAKDGSSLSALTKVEVRRGEDLAKIFDNPAPGATLTFTDVVPVNGTYTYTATAFTEVGGGDPATAQAFIGVNVPASASDVTAVNTSNNTAKISWQTPTLDKDGNPIASPLISFDVYAKQLYGTDLIPVAKDITANEAEFTLPPVDSTADAEAAPLQAFYSFSVVAKTVQGEAEAAQTLAPVPLGEPYEVPFLESFANGRAATIYSSSALDGNNYWMVTRDFEEVESADRDNGMIFLNGKIGGAAALYTGLVDLGTMQSPTLSYYTYSLTGCDPEDHKLQVTVTATDGTVKQLPLYAPASGWNKTLVPLPDFAGKTVRLEFDGYRGNNTELMLDAIAIENIFTTDLKAAGIAAPSVARSDEPFDIVVSALNAGSEAIPSFIVDLYQDGAKVDTYSGTDLGVGEYANVTFVCKHGILDPEKVTYSAKVSCPADMDTENNDTEAVEITVRKNSYPTVQDLTGEYSKEEGKVTLTWSEPDTSSAQPYETLETFESYPAWANSGVGDWVFVDKDQAQIAGFTEGVMPGIDAYSQQSWWIFDSAHDDFNNGSFATLSGTHFLASMVSGIKGEGYVQNDDWAISPLLFSGAQTITVNARSYSLIETDWESFQVLWSDGSTDPDDFTLIKEFNDIPSQYQAYEVELPEGARRFAIRNVSTGKYVLMVDDVTYIGTGDPAAFSIGGYNVYRDGERMNSEPVEENEFIDTDAGDGKHTYHVSVLYSAGESRLGNAFNANGNSLGVVKDSTPAEYFNLQGQRVQPTAPGIYIRRQGSRAEKIVK